MVQDKEQSVDSSDYIFQSKIFYFEKKNLQQVFQPSLMRVESRNRKLT